MDLLEVLGALTTALLVHEMGHIVMAKALGMRVETVKFFFGRTMARWRMMGTDWLVGWLPIGAYTTIPGAFAGRSLSHRMAVVAAGPVASALAAVVLTCFVVHRTGPPSDMLVLLASAHAVLAFLSLSPITGADSPALIGMIADHWFLGTGGRIVLALWWTALPIGLALLLQPLLGMIAACW